MFCQKKASFLSILFFALLILSSCSVVGFILSDCGGEETDLVVYNSSSTPIGSALVELENESTGMSYADPKQYLERGNSWGCELSEQSQYVVVELFDPQGDRMARGRVLWPGRGEGAGDRIWAIYDGGAELGFQWEAPEE